MYIDQLQISMAKYGVQGAGWRSYKRLGAVLRDQDARREISEILKTVAAHDGGKVGVGVIGLVLAAAIGGVGVAAMGSAFGLSAAFVTALGALGGALLGNELDGSRWTKKILDKFGYSTNSSHNLESGQRTIASGPVEGEVLAKPERVTGFESEASARAMAKVEDELRGLRRLIETHKERSEAAFVRVESNQDDFATAQTAMQSEFKLMFEQSKIQQAADIDANKKELLSLQEALIDIRQQLRISFESMTFTFVTLEKRITIFLCIAGGFGILATIVLLLDHLGRLGAPLLH